MGPFFFADTTINVDPTAEELVDITLLVAKNVERFKVKPSIAMLSYSNFGSNEGAGRLKNARCCEDFAVEITQKLLLTVRCKQTSL